MQEHLGQVRAIAMRIREHLPRHVELDDLVQAGIMGLMDAASRYDERKNVQFSSYAQFRIRGAIMDSLRSLDVGSRDLRRHSREIEQARHRLATRWHSEPSDEEIAGELGVPVASVRAWLASLQHAEFVDLSGDLSESNQPNPMDRLPSPAPGPRDVLMQREIGGLLARAIEQLRERERQVLSLYYYEELNMKEVGEVLGVVESRVSQIHTAAIAKLRGIVSGKRRAGTESQALPLRVLAATR